jgi:hypothetical protein
MAQGVVFKHWYRSANLSDIAIRNQKHLEYIATRKGAIPNPGCAFGLWGRLPYKKVDNIYSLEQAKKAVGAASAQHTLFRSIVSVDKDTSEKYDLYNRATWETLVNQHIKAIAKDMEIEPKDFCWLASMHHKKTHPHVHIIYWDNSNKVRQEQMPKERFEIFSEKVRAAFNRGIFQEEIPKLQKDQKEVLSEVKLELLAMCREVNLAEALNLDHVKKAKMDELTRSFADLVLALPKKGSFKYQSLPKDFSNQLNSFIADILKVSDFRALEKKYLEITDEISDLYGNGDATKQHNHDSAQKKLYANLGNGILDIVREYLAEQRSEAPTEQSELRIILRDQTKTLLQSSDDYRELLTMMPKLRTPLWEIRKNPQFEELYKKLASDLCNDVRNRTKIQGYTNAKIRDLPPARAAKAGDTVEHLKRTCKATVKSVNEDGSLTLESETKEGKSYETTAKQEDVRVAPESPEEESVTGTRDKADREAYKSVCDVLDEQLGADSGYESQMQAQTVVHMLLRLFADCSRGKNQQQSQRDLAKFRSKDMSDAAKRDRQKQREQGSAWDFEM